MERGCPSQGECVTNGRRRVSYGQRAPHTLYSARMTLRRALSRLPLRWKMAIVSAAAVLTTLVLVLTPVYLASRSTLTTQNAKRLAAIAASAAVAIPASSVDSIAQFGRNTAAFVHTRDVLRRMWDANGGDTRELTNGMAVVPSARCTGAAAASCEPVESV